MKTKTIFKVLFFVLLGLSLTSVQGQNRRAKHQRAHIHSKKGRHRHSPHHRYAKLPKWGKSYASVHRKAHRIAHRGVNFHYHSGIYYKKAGAKYIIARAPLGVKVPKLPRKKIRCMVKGRKYYYYYGTFYVKTADGKEYETVNPPVGARVDALPEGYKEIQKSDSNYYEFEGTLYKEITSDHETYYEVVKEID